ncbi:peptidoglycan/xylan/chitin deacetylase (PgdA/CDA1 family) [Kitasatospora sp. MAP12-15]|uniref:polysaccharide deacetylase family protein n=1 Tax=unclassified Kitasatospora TaxID=2633591 RepID=UPI002473A91F|nr:polysaccharide deacetylase family protein [Kitasatospora sp. MAP12-44]MDH6115293.1 peptidoglycan/xylan/chitin deacetylase (PgdA/CDA1 family) [Kitasatospora sp. MAP12-44]
MTDSQTSFSRRLLLAAGGATLLSSCAAAGTTVSAPTHSAKPPAPAGETASASPAAQTSASPAEPPAESPAEPAFTVDAGPMTAALTFDDGPSPIYTAQILALLRQYGVTATFFMIGANVEKYPDVVRQVVDEGHRLGNHTWSHPDLGDLSDAQIRDEIERTSDLIATVGRTRPPVLFRAPGGNFTPASLTICADLGLRPISWSVDPMDWSRPGTDVIVATVMDHTRTGSIVLEHDGCLTDQPITPGGPADRSQTVAALADYLPRLLHAGYRFTTVGPTP